MRWTVDSETGTLRDVLLCRPDHYEWIPTNSIARQTIGEGRRIDHQRLQAQYRELEDALDQAGVQRHYIEPAAHLNYQVYTRDSSQTTPWGPVLTQLAMPQRRGEYAALLDFHGPQDGFWHHATMGTIEGGDIHIVRPGLLIVGWSGGRTSQAGAEEFTGWFKAEGWEVRLEAFDDHFLHLDVLFCMAADRLAVACIEVLGDEFGAWLAERGIKVIAATYREVMAMSCNLLALGGGRVISPKHSARINGLLRAEGIEVLDPELDLFASGGGSVHCMTMPLKRDAV